MTNKSTTRQMPLRRPTAAVDFTLPLRMQVRGRSPAERHRLALRRLLWKASLLDRCIWLRACGFGAIPGLIQLACDPAASQGTGHGAALQLIGRTGITIAVAVLAAAGTHVHAQMEKTNCSMN